LAQGSGEAPDGGTLRWVFGGRVRNAGGYRAPPT
jgi:hypothetical protein